MSRHAFGRNPLPGRELTPVPRRAVEEPERGLARRRPARNERWPHDVNATAGIDGDRRPVLGTSVENPPVFADSYGRCERFPAITGHRERDVADVSRVDMSPRRVDGAIAAGGDRRLA